MDPKTRSLIEILRDETQSRSVFERCNEVLAAMRPDHPNVSYWNSEAGYITASEAEVEIIAGERK